MINFMEVIIMRHGKRPYTTGDVPLNEAGQRQAEELTHNPTLLKTKTLLSSPKKRAQMTLEPLSQYLKLPLLIEEQLDQHHADESENDFKNRIKQVINNLEKGKWEAPVLLCSHSDWLSLATQFIPTDELNLEFYMFQCAEYLHFKIEEGLWKLQS